METLESGFIENKGVPACKQIGASQFPIGDDVSALHPLRSSVPFVFSYTDADETKEEASSVIVRRLTNLMTPRIHPSI